MCSPSPSSAAILFNLTSVSSPTAGEGQTSPIATSYALNVTPQFNAATLNFDSRVNAAANGRAAELFGGERLRFPTAVLLTHQQAYALAVGGQVSSQCGGVTFENATDPTLNSLTTTSTTNNNLQQPLSTFYDPHQDSIAVPPFYAPPAGVTLCHPVYGVTAGEVPTTIGGESNNCGPLISSTSQLLNELDVVASTSLQPVPNNRLLLCELPEASTLETIYPVRSQHTAAIDNCPQTAPYPFGHVTSGCLGVQVGGDQRESAVAETIPPSSNVEEGHQNGGSSDSAASRRRNGKEVVAESLRKWRKRKNTGEDGRSNKKEKKADKRDTTAKYRSSTSLPDASAGNQVIANELNSSETGSTTGLSSTQQQRQRRVELDAIEVERRRQQLLVSREPPICAGCAQLIRDRTLMMLMGDKDPCYHDACLKCSVCELDLTDFPACYVKESAIYCRSCYSSKFHATKCTACERQIQPTDWVRRARDFLYHLACFACQHCKRQLSTGEEFSLQDNQLLCRQHYLELVQGEDCGSKQKMKRVRTTFAEEQIGILQTHFQIDSNPDGADLERIANLTGLSKRVTQVWFQNNRARQKKYQGAGSSTVRSRSRQTNNTTTNQPSEQTETLGSRNNSLGGETSETPLPPPYSSPDASSDEAQRISDHSSTLSN